MSQFGGLKEGIASNSSCFSNKSLISTSQTQKQKYDGRLPKDLSLSVCSLFSY